ncbi:UNVERIFIED_CONTAM: hypothetical protein RMT77_006460 [Armadillidium vulgare]
MSSTIESRRKNFDLSFFKNFPGIFIVTQLACCCIGFFLGVGGHYYKSVQHVFFLLTTSMASFSTTCWIVFHFCEVKSSSVFRGVDWNKVGIIHSAIFGFFVMVGSACMIEVSYAARSLRAAGVFGFFGFTAFLIHLCWEVTRYLETTLPKTAAIKVTISKRFNQPHASTPIKEDEDDDNFLEPIIDGSYNRRPESGFFQQKKPNEDIETSTSKDYSKINRISTQSRDSFDSEESNSEINPKNKKNSYNL